MNPLLYNDIKVIEIIYEDDYCIVVNKPNNLLVHHSYYSRNIEEDSLVQLLKLQGYESPIPVHRLDRKTSGILLLAKNICPCITRFCPFFHKVQRRCSNINITIFNHFFHETEKEGQN